VVSASGGLGLSRVELSELIGEFAMIM